jgi:hypothetical protein
MAWAAVASAGIGAAGSLLGGGGGGGSSGATTQTVTNEPWSGIKPFLLGDKTRKLKAGVTPIYGTPQQVWNPGNGGGGDAGGGTGGFWETKQSTDPTNPESDWETVENPGIYTSAQDLYKKGGWSSDNQALVDQMSKLLAGQNAAIPGRTRQADATTSLGNALWKGEFNYNPTPGAAVTAPTVDLTAARKAQGVLDPTSALAQLLSGTVNNDQLEPQAQAITRDVTDNLQRNILPRVSSAMVTSGGYGGSRQGVIEANAMKDANTTLSSALAALRGTAFERAQDRQATTANAIDSRAAAAADVNAGRSLDASKFNVGTTLQNNEQRAASLKQNLGNQLTGTDLMGRGNELTDANTAKILENLRAMLGLSKAGSEADWANLNKYAAIIQPGTGIGGTTTQSTPYFTNPAAGALGTGLAAYSMFGGGNGGGLASTLFGGGGAANTPPIAGTYMSPATASTFGGIQF